MATFIPAARPTQAAIQPVPLTLTTLQVHVGGFIAFVDLPSGDMLVINEASVDQLAPLNVTASSLAGQSIYGDVVLCTPGEIA